MVDLGFIGRILLLNMVEQDCAAAGKNKDEIKFVEQPKKLAKHYTSKNPGNIFSCIRLLRKPTAIILFLSATAPVDLVIKNIFRQFHPDNLSQTKVQLCLKRYSPKINSKEVEPNFL